MFPVRPLGSTGIAPLPSYYGPVRLPTRATRGLFLPQGGCGWGHSLPGLPGSSVNLSACAVPYHPGEPNSCSYLLLHCRHWASPILDGWPLPYSFTRPNRIRLRYGSRFRLTRLRQTRLPRPALDRLHVKRTIHMVGSFQPTRLARLCLAHQDTQDITDFLSAFPGERQKPSSGFAGINGAFIVLTLLQILLSQATLSIDKVTLCRRQIAFSRFLQETGKAKKSYKSYKSCQATLLLIKSSESIFKEPSRNFIGGSYRSKTSWFVCDV